jgi:hypothetical protein
MRTAVGALILIASFRASSFAQSDADRLQKARETVIGELNDAARKPMPRGPLSNDAKRVKQDVDRFVAAVAAYGEAVLSQASLEKPLKELKGAVSSIEYYSRATNNPKIDKPSYTGLSRADLSKETLKAADLVKADLSGVIKISQDPYLLRSRDAWKYLGELHAAVERLQFLIDKTQSAK